MQKPLPPASPFGCEAKKASEQCRGCWINGTVITFKNDLSVADATGSSLQKFNHAYYSQGPLTTAGPPWALTTGNANFDNVLDSVIAYSGAGNSVITLKNLTPGVPYAVLLIAGDIRAEVGSVRPINFSDPNSSTNVSATWYENLFNYEVGLFTATGSTQAISENYTGGGAMINAVVVYEMPTVTTNVHLSAGCSNATLTLTWPLAANDLGLYCATNLAPPIGWARVTNGPVAAHGLWTVTIPAATNGRCFYRLQSN